MEKGCFSYLFLSIFIEGLLIYNLTLALSIQHSRSAVTYIIKSSLPSSAVTIWSQHRKMEKAVSNKSTESFINGTNLKHQHVSQVNVSLIFFCILSRKGKRFTELWTSISTSPMNNVFHPPLSSVRIIKQHLLSIHLCMALYKYSSPHPCPPSQSTMCLSCVKC